MNDIPLRTLWLQSEAHLALGDLIYTSLQPNIIRRQITKTCSVNGDLLQPKEFFDYFAVGGNWHQHASNFNQDHDYLQIKDIFDYRNDFKKSPSYRSQVQKLSNAEPQKDYLGMPILTEQQLQKTFQYYLDLLTDIEANGFDANKPSLKENGDDAIGVALTPSFEFFHFRTGHHRLAIAQILNLLRVPVKIHLIHLSLIGNNPIAMSNIEIQRVRNILMRVRSKE